MEKQKTQDVQAQEAQEIRQDMLDWRFASGFSIEIKAKTRQSKEKIELRSLPKEVQEAILRDRKEDIFDGKDKVNQWVYKYPQIEQTLVFDLSGDTLERVLEKFAASEMRIKAQSILRSKGTKWMKENSRAKFRSLELGVKQAKSSEDIFVEMSTRIYEIAQDPDRAQKFQVFLGSLKPETRRLATLMFQGAVAEVDASSGE